jgi:outer membrane lipoprotein-sorting protein
MLKPLFRPLALALVTLAVAATGDARPGARGAGAPQLDQLAALNLSDLEARVKVLRADQAELGKINRDFGLAYMLKDITMRFKEPNKLRMEGSIGSIVMNGSARHFRVPALHLSKRDDLGESPGRRYTLLDVGLLTRSSAAAVDGHYLRDEKVGEIETRVFEAAYRGDTANKYVLWVDPKTHVVAKREWLDGEGKLKATFLYQAPTEVSPGVWVPTRVEIRNRDDAVAAVTSYSEVKVNQGLSDSLFEAS